MLGRSPDFLQNQSLSGYGLHVNWWLQIGLTWYTETMKLSHVALPMAWFGGAVTPVPNEFFMIDWPANVYDGKSEK